VNVCASRFGALRPGNRCAVSVIDPTDVAAEAGLRHVVPADLPITRRRHGGGFTYVDGTGRRLTGSRRARVERLAIPPAWTDVRVAADTRAHIQAVGVDDRGRTQYRYHDGFRDAAEAAKFARLGDIARAMPRFRRRLDDELDGADAGTGDLAIVVALIDHTLIRVGTQRYADENESFGASTLRCDHVVDGSNMQLCYQAKGGHDRCLDITDQTLAASIRRCRDRRGGPDEPLFCGPEGGMITGSSVAEALCDWSGVPMSAKDLRTWGATAAMIGELASPLLALESSSSDPVIAAFDGVAARLGNTRDIARSSYVAPTVTEAYEDGTLDRLWSRSRRSSHFSRAEQTARKLFAE
jgi:DNA topoisomerase-1